jgi:hypothetical protein
MAKRNVHSAGPNSKKRLPKTGFANFLLLFISLAIILYFLGSYHFLRTPIRTMVIPKLHFGFQATFLDLRKWSTLDLYYHIEVEQAIRATGGQHLLNQIKNSLTQVDE